jgi:hypothetical protein
MGQALQYKDGREGFQDLLAGLSCKENTFILGAKSPVFRIRLFPQSRRLYGLPDSSGSADRKSYE